MTVNWKDLAAGMIFFIIGTFFCIYAVSSLTLGTSFRMGPGYFPMLAGGLVALLGVIIVIKGIGSLPTPFGTIPWRGLVLINLAPIVFGICVRGLGLAPTIALASLITCFASYKVGPLKAVAITGVLTVFCLAISHYGLGLPIPLLGPWLHL
jgi:hypothetical protein